MYKYTIFAPLKYTSEKKEHKTKLLWYDYDSGQMQTLEGSKLKFTYDKNLKKQIVSTESFKITKNSSKQDSQELDKLLKTLSNYINLETIETHKDSISIEVEFMYKDLVEFYLDRNGYSYYKEE